MDTSLISAMLQLAILLPVLIVLASALLYANLTTIRKAKLARQQFHKQTSIKRGHKKLYIIDTERK